MLVRMLRNTSGPDGLACWAGEVVDLPDPVARSYVMGGRAVPVEAAAAPVEVTDRQVTPPTRRGKR